jgi:hypothetical protein
MTPVVTYAHAKATPSAAGNTQYTGGGIVKWCALCGVHKPQLGGTLRFVLGGRHWVCIKHSKTKRATP